MRQFYCGPVESGGKWQEKKEGGNEEELNERTRERFREKLRNGELDDRKIELEVNAPTSQVHIMGPGGWLASCLGGLMIDRVSSYVECMLAVRQQTATSGRSRLLSNFSS